MYRREPLFEALEAPIISSGLRPDLHPLHTPLWVKGENARFHHGKVERLIPPSGVVAAEGIGRGLSQVQDSTGVRWIWWGNDIGQARRWYGPASELITTLAVQQHQSSAIQASMFDFTHYGDWTIVNNGNVPAKIHKPGVGLSDYAASLGKTLQFMKLMSFVLGIGYDNGKRYGWSDSLNIEDWNFADTENLAGSAPIEDFNTPIRAANRLGQYISVFAEDQMGLVQFVGLPAVFTHRVVLDGIGAVGKLAVTTDGRSNFGVSRNGVWQTDGQGYRYIDKDRALQKYLQENVNWDQASKIIAARNDVTGCIEFHFPLGAALENTEGWAYDPESGGWGRVTPLAAQVERALFRKPLGINPAAPGWVLLLDDNPALEAPLDLETKPFVLGSPHLDTYIDEADFLLNSAENVEFRLGVSQTIEDADFLDWSDWQTLETDMRVYRIKLRVSGAYHKLQLRSTAADWSLDLQGFLLYGQTEGTKRDVA